MNDSLLIKLLELNPHIVNLNQQPILNERALPIGWNCYFVEKGDRPFAGGTSSKLATAKRIAVAESFERALFRKILQDKSLSKKLLLDESPSTSGFAAGFDSATTSYRSVCEAVERWAWSKWIDSHHLMTELPCPKDLTELSKHLISHFDSTKFYCKNINADFNFNFPKILKFGVFIGFKNGGVFAGSRVTSTEDDLWEHATIESYRNLKNFEIKDSGILDSTNLIGQRARYFGQNAAAAIVQIERANIFEWPFPTIRLHTNIETNISGVYLSRTLCNDFILWHFGDESRFVY